MARSRLQSFVSLTLRSKIGSHPQPTNQIQLSALGWLLGIKLVQAVEPCKLEQLLGEEEAADEIRHGTPEGKVRIMDI